MKLTTSILAVAAMAALSTGAYATAFSDAHLTYYWNFDSSSTAYTSPNGNGTGGITNEPTITYPTPGFDGTGVAAGFGPGDFYSTNATGLNLSSFSVSLHVNNTSTTGYRDYFGIGTDGGGNTQYFLESMVGGNGIAIYSDNTTSIEYQAANINDGNWHQLGLTSDGTTLKLYVDGSLAGQTAIASAPQSGALSAYEAGGALGRVTRRNITNEDDLSIWNTTLTAGQMSQLNTTVATDIAAVPEPSTVVLAMIFGIGMLFLFRRRRIA